MSLWERLRRDFLFVEGVGGKVVVCWVEMVVRGFLIILVWVVLWVVGEWKRNVYLEVK